MEIFISLKYNEKPPVQIFLENISEKIAMGP